MRASVDLAKLIGDRGNAIIVPGARRDVRLQNTDAALNGEAGTAGYDAAAGRPYRARRD